MQKKKLKKIKRLNLPLILMCIPAMIVILIFNYLPMLGIIIAFKNFKVNLGILRSPFVGFKNFEFFFKSQDAFRITRNTIGLNILFISLCLIISVLFALLLNEISKRRLTKTYQTIFFFPYFLSWIVASYMLFAFLNMRLGILNQFLQFLGFDAVRWYNNPSYWPFILVIMYVWKNVGYFSIIYYAGIMGIDSSYYEAAVIDGASKFQMMRKITIPLISPLITIITILQIGKIFFADFGMFYFLPKDIGILYPTTDVIDTYVYRSMKVTGNIGMASAAGVYQSIVGFILVITTNTIVKRFNRENALF